MKGKVLEVTSTTQGNNPVPKEVIVDYENFGEYELPAQQLDNAFIEIGSAKKLDTPLPSFTTLCRKRDRTGQLTLQSQGDAGAAADTSLTQLRYIAEHISGTDMKPKIEICQGLKVMEDQSIRWHAFRIYEWVTLLRSKATQVQRDTTIQAWKVELFQALTDASVNFAAVQDGSVAAVRSYNDARDQYALWLSSVHEVSLNHKGQWRLGFMLLFTLIGSAVSINFGFNRGGQVRSELIADFEKTSALIDTTAVLNRVFSHGRKGGSSTDRSGRNNNRTHVQQRLGSKTATGTPGEKECFRCHTWHFEPNAKPGHEFWRTHKCTKQ
jgi:hypothetical protein